VAFGVARLGRLVGDDQQVPVVMHRPLATGLFAKTVADDIGQRPI